VGWTYSSNGETRHEYWYRILLVKSLEKKFILEFVDGGGEVKLKELYTFP
jgi:hypothetical protein